MENGDRAAGFTTRMTQKWSRRHATGGGAVQWAEEWAEEGGGKVAKLYPKSYRLSQARGRLALCTGQCACDLQVCLQSPSSLCSKSPLPPSVLSASPHCSNSLSNIIRKFQLHADCSFVINKNIKLLFNIHSAPTTSQLCPIEKQITLYLHPPPAPENFSSNRVWGTFCPFPFVDQKDYFSGSWVSGGSRKQNLQRSSLPREMSCYLISHFLSTVFVIKNLYPESLGGSVG